MGRARQALEKRLVDFARHYRCPRRNIRSHPASMIIMKMRTHQKSHWLTGESLCQRCEHGLRALFIQRGVHDNNMVRHFNGDTMVGSSGDMDDAFRHFAQLHSRLFLIEWTRKSNPPPHPVRAVASTMVVS